MTLKSSNSLRIVSLLPSATEILCRLGLEKNLVGVSHECDFPSTIQNLPKLTKPKIDPNRKSLEIHNNLKSLLSQGLSIYEVDVENLRKLSPDLIITQDQCHVCAVSFQDLEKAICQWTQIKTEICTLSPHTLDDIHRDFTKIGKATNREAEAKDLITEFWIRLNRINSKVGTDIPTHPRVLCIEWLDPLMVAGGWIPEIIKIAGGIPQIISRPEKFKEISWIEVMDCDPDIVTLFPCGYPISKTLDELRNSHLSKQISSLRAFREGKVFVCDGNQLFNRPGPRIIESCELLSTLFHPQKFESTLTKNKEMMYTRFLEGTFK